LNKISRCSATAVPTKTSERLLWWVIAGTRGGATRARIISLLKEHPSNASQIADQLGLDYKTIRHHIGVLEENRLLARVGGKYAATYFLSSEMESNYGVFKDILNRSRKTKTD
jgi:DNA-binding transcriptional ArsR family regulator